MPHAAAVTFTVLAAIAALPFAAPQDPPPQPPKPAPADLTPGQVDAGLLQRLTWLCGTWVLQDGGTTTEEHWRPLQGNTILGSSHTFSATKTLAFEHLRITASRGAIAYIAQPGGGKGTAFLLRTLEDGRLVFENPEHDHPQRIRYEKTDDGLVATIEQLDGSKQQRFVFRRAAKQ
ncbi:MAG: hypothetical protein JNL08_17535 [Planctomycetes bacterium]|nr:hypothetical protein [Planctomycetota bacterium]